MAKDRRIKDEILQMLDTEEVRFPVRHSAIPVRQESEPERSGSLTHSIPQRTRLYPLAPIGTDTPFVESLSSYISRLAEAHAVSVSDLVRRELFATSEHFTCSSGVVVNADEQWARGYHVGLIKFNGAGINSKSLTNVLEKATGQADLRSTTLLPFEGALTFSGNTRSRRAWCPKCYADWKSSDSPIYEPLLWTMALVKTCLIHGLPLEKQCPSCRRCSKQLSAYIRPGHCAFCDYWLGSSREALGFSGDITGTSKLDRGIGELLKLAPRLRRICAAAVLRQNLLHCMHVLTGKNLLWFARICGVSKSSLWWALQSPEPKAIAVRTLLLISESMNLPIKAFFEDNAVEFMTLFGRAGATTGAEQFAHVRRTKTRSSGQCDVADQVQAFLDRASQIEILRASLSEATVPSLSELKNRVGPAEFLRIRYHQPELYKQLLDRHKLLRAQHIYDLRTQLQKIVTEVPYARSVGQVEKQLGISQGNLSKLFPDICSQLRAQCLASRREGIVMRQKELIEEVYSIVGLLYSRNTQPTVRLVRSLLNPDIKKNRAVFLQALRAAKKRNK